MYRGKRFFWEASDLYQRRTEVKKERISYGEFQLSQEVVRMGQKGRFAGRRNNGLGRSRAPNVN